MPRAAKANRRTATEIESAFNSGEDVLDDFNLESARFVSPGESYATAARPEKPTDSRPQSYHLFKKGDSWSLSLQGAAEDSKIFTQMTKAKAMRAAVKFVRSNYGSIKIHRADGSVQEERVYPRPPAHKSAGR